MAKQIVWFEVLGKDAKALRAFYSKMFDWQFSLDESALGKETDYGNVDASQSGIGGGIGRAWPGESGWTTIYVAVPDLDAAIEQAKTLGGTTLVPITELPNLTIAVVADPEGHPVGLIQQR